MRGTEAARAAQPGTAGRTTRGLRAIGRFLLWIPRPLGGLFALAWMLLIWDLSSHRAPTPAHPSLLWEWLSNLAHAPLFGTLTLLVAALALREGEGHWPSPRRARVALVLGCVLAYGALDEWHQSRIPGRDSSMLDVVTDLVSGAVVLWIVYTLGDAELRERQLLARLGTGVLLCCASALLASLA